MEAQQHPVNQALAGQMSEIEIYQQSCTQSHAQPWK